MPDSKDDQINLRECVKLKNGPFNGVTIQAYNSQDRVLLTQQDFTTAKPAPVYVYEYQRNEKPQFTYVGRREAAEGDQQYEPLNGLDESDRREGFEDGLHRALDVIYDHLHKCPDNDWQGYNALSAVMDEIREIGLAMGFDGLKLYAHYEQEKDYNAPDSKQKEANDQCVATSDT